MICPECFNLVKKVKPKLWYCKNCHVFLFHQESTEKILVSKKEFLNTKIAVSKPYLFQNLINQFVSVECVEDITVEGILLNVEPSKSGAFGNVLVETCNPAEKTEILIRGNKIKTIKII